MSILEEERRVVGVVMEGEDVDVDEGEWLEVLRLLLFNVFGETILVVRTSIANLCVIRKNRRSYA